jgi:GH15 family glucan-1,4-alpha-glucosidase
MMNVARAIRAIVAVSALVVSKAALAVPSIVEHAPASAVFGEPASTTQREPEVPREDELVALSFRVSFQFTYNRVALYYTTDGTEPSGSFGSPAGTTQVLLNTNGGVTFLRNENNGGTRDWWTATLPAATRQYAQNIKYKISAWEEFGGPEVFANGGLTFSYSNKLAWPGAGAGSPNPSQGYPPVSFWKEEAVFGNGYCAGQLDQNGTVYDFHFPTPGGVYGVGTKNEGYVDGLDTFPAGLPQNWRGQMHLNQAMAGIRVDGTTYWLSNQNGVGFDQVTQEPLGDSALVRTTQRLHANGNNIAIVQTDYAPLGITFPTDNGGSPQRHIYLKTITLTNNGGTTKSLNVYWYLDPALNGGDTYDDMFIDQARNTMVAYDNTYRVVTGTGTGFTPPNEYNPTTSGGYEKNKSLYLACAMQRDNNGTPVPATDFWRDTSGDNSQGWMGQKVTLAPGQSTTIHIMMAGACDNFAGAAGTYDFQLGNVVTWFRTSDLSSIQSQTAAAWATWLNSGVRFNCPDAQYTELFEQSLVASALHVDKVNGGVIAGFHNGAYPYVWPRDAVYAAVTLARVGHLAEARGVYDWMKNTTYRDFEGWGRKGFWKQKYSTDGYVIWGAPQIDETAVFPWGVYYQYLMTGDAAMLNTYVEQVRDSVLSCSQTSTVDPVRLNVSFGLMYSNNVWEDSYDTFVYSNANVVRGLRDAASIFSALNLPADAADATARANSIKSALDARLDWDGENTDISQLGIVYPFDVYSPTDFRSTRVIDRINGVRNKFNNAHPTAEPLVNFSGEHAGTVNRYWGDGYWNGGPWFLTTLWYGLYYAQRQDFTPGTADIDNHKSRVDLMIDRLGPFGYGAEQIAYGTGGGASLLYPAQQDFKLQTAWPNAWESMSTFIDSIMAFADYTPDAPANTMRFAPKLPSAWQWMTFDGVRLVNPATGNTHSVDLTVERLARGSRHTFTNVSGESVNVESVLRIDPNRCFNGATRNGQPVAFTHDSALGKVTIATALEFGVPNATTILAAGYCSADLDNGSLSGTPDGGVDINDLLYFLAAFEQGSTNADLDDGSGIGTSDGGVDINDLLYFLECFERGCA